jgi:hypothetical protein
LCFVEEILSLDSAISQLSEEQFRGQPLLFTDTALKLAEQLDMAALALKYFNLFAKRFNFAEMSAESIRDKLRPEVNQQVSRWRSVARIAMLVVFGEDAELSAAFDQFIRTHGAPLPHSIAVPSLCCLGALVAVVLGLLFRRSLFWWLTTALVAFALALSVGIALLDKLGFG